MYLLIHMNPFFAATIILFWGRYLGNCGCNLIVLLAVAFMVTGAFFSLVDVGMYQNWIDTDIGH